MKEITAEIKFLAGVKNQCSVRKAGIGKRVSLTIFTLPSPRPFRKIKQKT